MKGKLENPVCFQLRVNQKQKVLKEYMKSNHYGLIIQFLEGIKVYPTENRVQRLIWIEEKLHIYEEGSDLPWIFDCYGNILQTPQSEENKNLFLKVKQFIKKV